MHQKDSDCTVGTDGCCTECGVSHGDACLICGGRAFHTEDCPDIFSCEGCGLDFINNGDRPDFFCSDKCAEAAA